MMFYFDYYPDMWVLVRVENAASDSPPFYKILSGWSGCFAQSDSWRFSSGLEPNLITKKDDVYSCPQSSGSIYFLHKNKYGMTNLMHDVLAKLQEEIVANNNGSLVLVDEIAALNFLEKCSNENRK
jgi:hypothetical protein